MTTHPLGTIGVIAAMVVFVVLMAMLVKGAWSAAKAMPQQAGMAPRRSGPRRPAAPAAPGVRLPPPIRPRRPRRKELPQQPPLPADATVSFAAERRAAGIDEIFAALDRDLIGLFPVKRKIREIASLLLVDRSRVRFGLTAPRPNLHMCFTGPPGTGKTTVALQMAELLHRLGYLEEGRLVHAMRDDLVGEYIGQTAPKTKRVLDRSMGGVLFIDEAYYLYRDQDSKDYGQETIDILLQVMENERDKLVVVLAGYKDRMDTFFESNPGMRSRIAHHLDFAPYEAGELVDIGGLMLRQANYYLSADAEQVFREIMSGQMGRTGFANARSVRNALEHARLQHALRLADQSDRPWGRDDLMRLEPDDVLAAAAALQAATAPDPAG